MLKVPSPIHERTGAAPAPARLGRLMAGPLAAVERFFERLFERPAARLFQARVEPVHMQRGLERAMESERRVHNRRAYVPALFRVLLHPSDLAALDGDRALMSRDLAEQIRVYARRHGYILLARPRVDVEASTAVAHGDLRVYAEPVVLPSTLTEVPRGGSRPPPDSPAQPMAAESWPVDSPAHATVVFSAPRPKGPHAQLAIRTPGSTVTRVPVSGGTMRIGRALDNDVVLADERVSRHHGQIGIRLGMLVYTDLDSTNGSYLHGSSVSEIALGPGDVLQLGSSTVTIEPGS